MARLLIGNIKGPQGAQGPTGPQGPQGVQGNPGQGVPTGGSAGQYLIKQSATAYDADWGAITTDSAPTSGGTNPITSGGVYTEAGKLAAGMAILANGNTHAAITSGQFVYVRGHGTLADGVYKATASIAANGTLSTSNLTAVSGGGLNAVIRSFGDIVSISSGSVSVATATNVEVASVTLTPGRWIVIGSIDWQANGTGFRQASFSDGINPARQLTSTAQGIAGKETYQQVVYIVATAEGTTSTLFARQDSGTTLNAYPAIYAIKIASVG